MGGDDSREHTEGLRPWDRQPGESEVAHQAFLAYRDSGIPRDLAATARVLGKHEGQLYRWKDRHQWGHRLLAWDAAQGKAAEETAQREWEKRRRRWSQAGDHVMQALLSRLLGLITTDPETGRARLDQTVAIERGLDTGALIMKLQRWLAEARAAPDGPPDAGSKLRRMASVELEKLKQLALEQEARRDDEPKPRRTRSTSAQARS